MNADCYFSMGKTHMVCQDYAYAGVNKNGNCVAIVSDGCSASPDTDFGSRFLVRSAKLCGENIVLGEGERFEDKLSSNSIIYASQAGSGLGLSSYCLDATLLYVEVVKTIVRIAVMGDGFVFAVRKDGVLEYWKIYYPSGAPFYSSYMLDKKRYDDYVEKCTAQHTIYHYITKENSDICTSEESFFQSDYMELKVEDYQFVGVASDGLDSFEGLIVRNVLKDLTSFKNIKGDFVKRRMRKYLKQCSENNTQPFDDVSMAVINLGD